MNKLFENDVLHMPRGFGKIVGKAVSKGLLARYVTGDSQDDASDLMAGVEMNVIFANISLTTLFGIQFVSMGFFKSTDHAFIIVEVLPGRFSQRQAKAEMEQWCLETVGRNLVAEEDAFFAEHGTGAVFTTERLTADVTWGIVSLTVPTLSATLHLTENTSYTDVRLYLAPREFQ